MSRSTFPIVVHVLAERASDGAIALLRRQATGFLDGYYAPPGGHLQAGEQVATAAGRELSEELGIRALDLTPVCVLPYLVPRHGQQGVNFLFRCSRWEGDAHLAEPELADDLIWTHAAGLPDRVPGWLPDALRITARTDKADWYQEFTLPG